MRTRILALLALAALVSPAPAWAHAGGRAQLYVASATVAPRAGGWSITTVLRDLDSGAPAPGFGVEVRGSGPSGAALAPLALTDDGDGRYEAALAGGTEGNWSLTVQAGEVPGGNGALPVQRTWTVALSTGRPVDLDQARP